MSLGKRKLTDVVDGYVVGAKLGAGGFGVVFEGTTPDGAPCALKRQPLHSENGLGAELLREVAHLHQLAGHPHVMRLHAVLRNAAHLYLVFDRMRGDLRHVATSVYGGAMPPAQVRSCVKQLCLALDYCHGQAIFHRDLKPQNVLIDDAGTVRLADLGSSRRVVLPRPLSPSCGTCWYRAPEVLLGMRTYGPSVDMWSTGCILWELAEGKPLFAGDSDIGQLFAIFRALGVPTEEVWPGVEALQDFSAATFPVRSLRPPPAPAALAEADALLLAALLTYDPQRRASARDVVAEGGYLAAALHPVPLAGAAR